MDILKYSRSLFIGVFLFSSHLGFSGNPQITHQNLMWIRLMGEGEIKGNWGWRSELEERAFMPWKQHQFISRTHLVYQNPKTPQMGLGMTFFRSSEADPLSDQAFKHTWEIRIQSELLWKQKPTKKITFSERIWIEERLQPNSDGVYRHDNTMIRLNAQMKVKLWENKSQNLSMAIFDEIFFQTLKQGRSSAFHHNRMGLNMSYQLDDKNNLELGYFNWYQLREAHYSYFDRHIIRTTFKHRF